MKQLTNKEVESISGGRKVRIHISLGTVFTAVGAFIIGGPVAGGAVVAAMLATQGAGQTYDILTQDPDNIVY